jgi:hypothetical protein
VSAPGSNPHKQGEHVFNDLATSAQNAVEAALGSNRFNALVLTARHGPLRLSDLPQTRLSLERLAGDPVLLEARSVTAPATGEHDDPNSLFYGRARQDLERALADLIESTAALLWRRKPRHNSSFHEFESIVIGMRDTRLVLAAARSAFSALVDTGQDPQAEKAALSERVGDVELERRRTIIDRMRQHTPSLRATGNALVDTFANEIELLLERRIGPA